MAVGQVAFGDDFFTFYDDRDEEGGNRKGGLDVELAMIPGGDDCLVPDIGDDCELTGMVIGKTLDVNLDQMFMDGESRGEEESFEEVEFPLEESVSFVKMEESLDIEEPKWDDQVVPVASKLTTLARDCPGEIEMENSNGTQTKNNSIPRAGVFTVETRSLEQRQKERAVALLRFKEKKASRSFKKRVRYECRKQLADSRPRVKGRFVKKSEIGLYRKYGDDYQAHLHELESCGSTISGGSE